MRYITCNYCQADDTEVVNHGPDLLLGRPGDFHLVRCRQCGLIYQNPQLTLEELPDHYPEGYQPYKKDPENESSTLRRLDVQYGLSRRRRQLLRHHPQPGRLLDVGCATGLFLKGMCDQGWTVAGVELSPYAADYARRAFGLDVFTGTLEEANLLAGSFDVVTMWDVLEHVIDPKATLAEVARILKPGGMLAISLPNPSCLEARLFGASWVGWDRPRHLHLFTPEVLRRYLAGADFQLKTIESLGGRLGLSLLSLEMWLRARNIPEEKWQWLVQAIYNWPLRLASWPLYRLAELSNKTTVMTAFAWRPAVKMLPN
ncbi:MAG: class I SAM-dependent methyltransferase [Chloroflexi bacterium]|nr:class I SAM-dependent methyltransferase [Chloroflexota bacterium]MCI0580101.1 class I SAM-dependent methyltransferase [Chloroflexota bacterium]MCI0649323.1 class I SAM-dependent methyltransferase [Chloroflexota bacterium]MCI0725944.1 class I SAM-dependent methyltransferase [Chloroflexota bacterium]